MNVSYRSVRSAGENLP